MSATALNLLVFRDGRRCVRSALLKETLVDCVVRLGDPVCSQGPLRPLLLAGELECGLSDSTASSCEEVTDGLAESLVSGRPIDFIPPKKALLKLAVPDQLQISVPEGFAYYALHPLAYADAGTKIQNLSATVAVIGIRSIGTTLSAVVAAALRSAGKSAMRITVRPHGHPYNRELQFSSEQAEFLRQALAGNADFLVVDEGPGLSGSSFLSVAEALELEGVSPHKMTLMCGHQPDFASFRATDGQRRASRFHWVPVDGTPRRPDSVHVFVGGGEWRRSLYPGQAAWPASWTSFERLKYLSSGHEGQPRLCKFLGLGHYGDEVFERERRVAEAGFGPSPQIEPHGFASYPWINGRPMGPTDLSKDVLRRLAEYCAFLSREFPANIRKLDALTHMANHNLAQLGLNLQVDLHLERPVIADGRMQPHEWLLSPDRQILKVDSGSHGDDHFFPGPTDIAWDLAGAIVEWQMDSEQTEFFLKNYGQLSGDNLSSRISDFLIAYSAFRASYCLMAANALHGSDEQSRHERAAASYRDLFLAQNSALVAVHS